MQVLKKDIDILLGEGKELFKKWSVGSEVKYKCVMYNNMNKMPLNDNTLFTRMPQVSEPCIGVTIHVTV